MADVQVVCVHFGGALTNAKKATIEVTGRWALIRQEDTMGSAHTTDQTTLPNGYLARGATLDDAYIVAQLRAVYQAEDGDATAITADQQLDDWLGLNLAEDTILVFAPDGSLAAHADIMNRRYMLVSVYGGVHPQHRRLGVGAYLVRWGEAWVRDHMDRAPADALIAVQHYFNTANESARALLAKFGYSYARGVYVMKIVMDEPPPAPEPIEGLSIRAFAPGQDERATFDAIEDAFRDSQGRAPGDFTHWLQLTEHERQNPDLWLLAEDEHSGEIVGTCLASSIPGGGGWVGGVGVRRPWRRRGLAFTMLRAIFGELYRRGEREVGLSVDSESPTGASRVYARAGMSVTHSVTVYRKQLRAGNDYSTIPLKGSE